MFNTIRRWVGCQKVRAELEDEVRMLRTLLAPPQPPPVLLDGKQIWCDNVGFVIERGINCPKCYGELSSDCKQACSHCQNAALDRARRACLNRDTQ